MFSPNVILIEHLVVPLLGLTLEAFFARPYQRDFFPLTNCIKYMSEIILIQTHPIIYFVFITIFSILKEVHLGPH